MTKVKTIKQYAADRGITTSSVYQLKSVVFIELPVFCEYEGERIVVGKQRFVKKEK